MAAKVAAVAYAGWIAMATVTAITVRCMMEESWERSVKIGANLSGVLILWMLLSIAVFGQ